MPDNDEDFLLSASDEDSETTLEEAVDELETSLSNPNLNPSEKKQLQRRLREAQACSSKIKRYQQTAAERFLDDYEVFSRGGVLWFAKDLPNTENTTLTRGKTKTNYTSNVYWEPEFETSTAESKFKAIIFQYLRPEELGYTQTDAAGVNKHSITNSDAKGVYDACKLIASSKEKPFYLKEDQYDSVFFPNGILKPSGFEPYPEPEPQQFSLAFNYKPPEKIPQEKKDKIDKWLKAFFKSQEIEEYALALYYTCLIPKCYEIAIFNVGTGSNGKSVLMEYLNKIINPCFVGMIDINSDSQFAKSSMENKLMIFQQEMDNSYLNVPVFKEITTNGSIQIEKKGTDAKSITNYSTLVINSNSDPKYDDSSQGVARRIQIIPFETRDIRNHPNALSETELNKLYTDEDYKLHFIHRMQAAFLKHYQGKNIFTIPEKIKNRITDNQLENNPVLNFLESTDIPEQIKKAFEDFKEDMITYPDPCFKISKTGLYDKFTTWSTEALPGTKTIGSKKFYTMFENFLDSHSNLYDYAKKQQNVTNQQGTRSKIDHYFITIADKSTEQFMEQLKNSRDTSKKESISKTDRTSKKTQSVQSTEPVVDWDDESPEQTTNQSSDNSEQKNNDDKGGNN